jgi:hypothetical protein
MKISKRSVPSNIEKALNEVPRGLQLADSLQHMDLELIAEINRAYDEAELKLFKLFNKKYLNILKKLFKE